MIDAPRSILRTFNKGPVAVELDKSAAADRPDEPGTAKVLERAGAATAEQRHRVPNRRCSALGPVFR